jgi:hypothetical protein
LCGVEREGRLTECTVRARNRALVSLRRAEKRSGKGFATVARA